MDKLTWDEPAGCSSPRGWLQRDGMPIAFYLDYGPDHYRTGHVTQVGPDLWVSFCQPGRECRECQPGNILCVRYPGGPRDSNTGRSSRYVETIAEARTYCETGVMRPPARATSGPRCAVCHRDAHRPGMGPNGNHGHAYQAPQTVTRAA